MLAASFSTSRSLTSSISRDASLLMGLATAVLPPESSELLPSSSCSSSKRPFSASASACEAVIFWVMDMDDGLLATSVQDCNRILRLVRTRGAT